MLEAPAPIGARARPSKPPSAGRGRFLAIPLIWGMELLPLRRSLLFTRAISRPGSARRLSPRAGGSRGAIGPTILSIDLPVAPVAISTILARLSHRRRAREAPRGSPCAGPFASDRALFAARQRANATPAKPTIGMTRSRTLEPWSRHAGPARGQGGREVIALCGVFGKSNPPVVMVGPLCRPSSLARLARWATPIQR